MPAKYYDYSLRGLKKDSTKYTALTNYRKKVKERKARMDFHNIKRKIHKKEDEDFLRRINGNKGKETDKS